MKDWLGMALAAGLWFCSLWLASAAYGAEVCGPAGCLEIADKGCYVEDGETECSTAQIACEEHLSPEQLREKYGRPVASLCGFLLVDELYAEILEKRIDKLRKKIRRLRGKGR